MRQPYEIIEHFCALYFHLDYQQSGAPPIIGNYKPDFSCTVVKMCPENKRPSKLDSTSFSDCFSLFQSSFPAFYPCWQSLALTRVSHLLITTLLTHNANTAMNSGLCATIPVLLLLPSCSIIGLSAGGTTASLSNDFPIKSQLSLITPDK